MLDTFINEKHSRGEANEDEQYPAHLKEYIERWEYIVKTKENPAKNKTQSEKNRKVQDSVTGVARPAGTAKGTKPRGSTRKGNEKELGATNLVKRGKEHNNPVPPTNPKVRKPDGDVDTDSDPKKLKHGGSNSVLGMMKNNAENQEKQAQHMADVMKALVGGQQVQSDF